MTRQGTFIVLDGIDGTGKSTQTRLLTEWLNHQGVPAASCRDPGGTSLGNELRAILLERHGSISLRAEALLFMASRAELVEESIRPLLNMPVVVISDRFLLANVVYQGHAGGLDPEEIRRIGQFSTNGIEPNITYVLDLPIEVAAERRGKASDRFEARDRDFQARIRQGFFEEARRQPDKIQIIDASPSIVELQHQLRERVRNLLHQRGFKLLEDYD